MASSFNIGFVRPVKDGAKAVLTGDAAVDDVVSGKTFYNTDAKTKITGTGANAKNYATGTITTDGSGNFTVTGLSFTPTMVHMSKTTTDSTNRCSVFVISSAGFSKYNGATYYTLFIKDSSGTVSGVIPVGNGISGGTFGDGNGLLVASSSYTWYAFG